MFVLPAEQVVRALNLRLKLSGSLVVGDEQGILKTGLPNSAKNDGRHQAAAGGSSDFRRR